VVEVRIGWFGPDDPDHPTAGQMWSAARLAVEEANEAGGYEGRPFRLVASWSENPWGTGIQGVTRLAYDEGIWAIVGGPDGPSVHLVEQVVAKARLAFVSPVATDKTANLANVPWIFSCAPGDHLCAPVLAAALAARTGEGDIAVASCTDHDSRMFRAELLKVLEQAGVFPAVHVEFRPGTADLDTQLQGIRRADPSVLALIAGAREGAAFLTGLRRAGLTMPVFGGPAMGRRLFLEAAGESAEGVIFPLLWDRSAAGGRSAGLAERFERRFGLEPDYAAAYTYDAVNLVIAAIRQAGLNRVRIRDRLRELSPWSGITGTITWDPTGHNHRPVVLAGIRGGRVVSY
jgi:branched-chain amino acid transport system substrate-binding protein